MNFSLSEMVFLFVFGLLLFGPKRLPEIARRVGKLLAEFKRASNEFQGQINEEVRKLELEGEIAKVKEYAQPVGQLSRGELLGMISGEAGIKAPGANTTPADTLATQEASPTSSKETNG